MGQRKEEKERNQKATTTNQTKTTLAVFFDHLFDWSKKEMSADDKSPFLSISELAARADRKASLWERLKAMGRLLRLL